MQERQEAKEEGGWQRCLSPPSPAPAQTLAPTTARLAARHGVDFIPEGGIRRDPPPRTPAKSSKAEPGLGRGRWGALTFMLLERRVRLAHGDEDEEQEERPQELDGQLDLGRDAQAAWGKQGGGSPWLHGTSWGPASPCPWPWASQCNPAPAQGTAPRLRCAHRVGGEAPTPLLWWSPVWPPCSPRVMLHGSWGWVKGCSPGPGAAQGTHRLPAPVGEVLPEQQAQLRPEAHGWGCRALLGARSQSGKGGHGGARQSCRSQPDPTGERGKSRSTGGHCPSPGVTSS